MNRTGLIGLVLTLLMLLLVLGSAFVFLFQGRRQLEAQRNTAVTDLSQAEQELDVTYNTLDSSTRALATAEATNLLLEGQLVASQQELDQLTAAMATRESEFNAVAQERDFFLSQVPSIEIISPTKDESAFIGTPLPYDIFVADGVGVTAVIVSIDNEPIDSFSLLERHTARVQGSWTPQSLGPVILGVQASNARTSVLVTQTITVTSATGQIVPLGEAPFLVERSEIETAVSEIRGLEPVEIATIPTVFQETPATLPAVPIFATTSVTDTVIVSRLFDFDSLTGQSQRQNNPIHYDPFINQFSLRTNSETFSSLDAYNYAEAYSTLLLDQNFNWPRSDLLSHDAWLAHFGLLAGETQIILEALLAADFFGETEVSQLNEILSGENNTWSGLLTEAGEAFAASFVDGNEYGRLNEVWQSLPASTEQLLHPEKYVAGEAPLSVSLPNFSSILGQGWQLIHQDRLGEAALSLYLNRFLNPGQVETAVSGWGGDQYAVYQNEAEGTLALILTLVWDSLEDSNEFAALYPNYPLGLFGSEGLLQSIGECWQGDDVICLTQNGDQTTIIRAPDLEMALLLGESISEN